MYHKLLSPQPDRVAERGQAYRCFSERHLQAMWMEQKYFHSLITLDGEAIEVLSPGIWNGEAGPDFLKAEVRIGKRQVRGNVEIHLAESDWMAHGHHKDPNYNDVILHVLFWEPKERKLDLPTVCVEPKLTIPMGRITSLIDLDLYPYRRFVGAGSCAKTLFRSIGEEKVRTLLHSAADWRLEEKRRHLSQWVRTPELRLQAGIAMALGYKQNSRAFLDLFLWLQEWRHRSQQEILAVAMGSCGFFESKFQDKWGESEAYRELQETWMGFNTTVLEQTTLVLHGIRPLNHPVRRLAYLAAALSDQDLLLAPFLTIWAENWSALSPVALRKKLLEGIPDYTSSHFSHHYTFETTAREALLPLVGETLKKQILVNTILPLLHEGIELRRDPGEVIAFNQLYSRLPASGSGKSKYLVHRFFGDTPKGDLLKKARIEQGAFQVHRDFCVHYEASCEGCPFVERVKNVFGLYPREKKGPS